MLATVFVLGGPLTVPSAAIDIRFHLEGPGENPAWDPDGAILLSIFEAAASYWESVFLDSRIITVDIEWDDDIDGLGLWTYDPFGNNNIEINSSVANWWADPTPYDSEEFNFLATTGVSFPGQTLYEELNWQQQNDWFNGPVPAVLEVGYRGVAIAGGAVGNFDLLSTAIHELGHELGIRGDAFEFYSWQVGGATGVQVEAGPGGHIAPRSSLMCDSCGEESVRRLPSATDILAVARAGGYGTLSMSRTEFLNVNNNFSDPLNWIGGMSGAFNGRMLPTSKSGCATTAK